MRTIVVIGASNVTFSLPVIWSTLRQSLADPFRLIVAAGHGRSFGLPNTFLGRTLPSILECDLWESLTQLKPASVHAIVTDVGNDLLYGADSVQTMHWVTETISRLEANAANIVVTGLPVGTLKDMSARRFEFFRRIMFPHSTLTFEAALDESETLHHQLLRTEDKDLVSTATPAEKWYGLDPIHIRRHCRREAWQQYLSMCIPDTKINHCGLIPDWSVWKGAAKRRWKRSQLLTSQQPTQTINENELWMF